MIIDWTGLYPAEPTQAQWRGVAAIYLGKGDRRVVGKAREAAQELGCYLTLFAPGAESPAALGSLGADRVCPAGSLESFLERVRPELLILSPVAVEPAARLAQRCRLPILGPAFELRIELSTREAIAAVKAYGGRMIFDLSAGSHRPQIVLLDPEALPDPVEDTTRPAEVILP